jgi:hypothetical protein
MLDRTMGSFNLAQFSAQVGPVVQQAQAGGKEVVDYAFWKGILLVVIVLVAALIYRFLVTRLLLPGKNQEQTDALNHPQRVRSGGLHRGRAFEPFRSQRRNRKGFSSSSMIGRR